MNTRRRFLATAVGAGGLAALGLWRAPAALRRAERSARALGTTVRLTVFHEEAAVAERAIEASFAALDGIEDALSLYRPGSALVRLNRDGALGSPPADLVAVLDEALAWSRRTGGAFDPTVQPLWAVHAAARQEGRTPAPEEVERARALVDWTQVDAGSGRIRLGRPGMAVTLNGIAQGFAADRVRATLLAHGVRHALADTGETAALGRKPDGEPWRVGVQHPRRPDAWAALATVEDRFMATSGDYATAFTDDFRSHHIFDPATGRSPGAIAGATVLAPRGIDADALSTALFVLGPEKGMALAASRPGVDAMLVLKDGSQLSTPAFPRTA